MDKEQNIKTHQGRRYYVPPSTTRPTETQKLLDMATIEPEAWLSQKIQDIQHEARDKAWEQALLRNRIYLLIMGVVIIFLLVK